MNTTVRFAGFAAALAVVLVGGWATGSAVGPLDTAPGTELHGGMDEEAAMLPGGLAVAQDGYRLTPDRTVLAPGTRPIRFTVDGPDGEPVTRFATAHEKKLHLIVVRRDFAGFQHVHPTMDAAGVWTTPVDLAPGQWRMFADMTPAGGGPLVLGADLAVPGDVPPPPSNPVSRSDTVDGLRVTLTGTLRPGEESAVTLTVTRAGAPVRDLEPYLGAYGHLVALREGDLAYLHVHPSGEPGDGVTEPGPAVAFEAEVPSAGRYHLYLDFKHDGVVRTARFTVDAK